MKHPDDNKPGDAGRQHNAGSNREPKNAGGLMEQPGRPEGQQPTRQQDSDQLSNEAEGFHKGAERLTCDFAV